MAQAKNTALPAARGTTSFLVDQGQIPRAAPAATKPLQSISALTKSNKKVVTVAQANALIELEDRLKAEKVPDRQQILKLEEELNSTPALRALIKYLRKISYSDKYNDIEYEYR